MVRAGWNRWGRASINRKVLVASAVLASLTVICKLAAAGREVVTAYMFGAGDAVDAFVVAFAIASFAITVIANAAGSALLPTLANVETGLGRSAAVQLLREATFWCLLLLAAAAAGIVATSPWTLAVVSPGFDGSKQVDVRWLLLLLSPAVVFHGVASLWGAVLHSQERFAATGLVPVLTPLCAILFMLLAGAHWGIGALAGGIVAGSAAEAAALGWTLRKSGFRLSPRPTLPSPALRQVIHQYYPLVTAAALMGSTTLVDNAMASQLGAGSVATLSYGRKLVGLAISIPAFSLSRAVFPYFSKLVATYDWRQVRQTLSTYRRAIILGTVPLTFLMVLLSRPLTAFVLEHGAFDTASTDAVAWVQLMYAWQIPFFTLAILHVRLISSLRLNHLLIVSTLISVTLNVVLNYLLMQTMGVAGIALSTSLVYACACGFLIAVTGRVLAAKDSAVTQGAAP